MSGYYIGAGSAAVTLILFAWSLCAVTPCTCLVPFNRFMLGERCPKHEGYTTEIGERD